MPDEMVIRHCAPTLASIKTGSLFSCPREEEREVLSSVCALNRRLAGKGLRVLPLRRRDGKRLVYVYRPKRLERDLSDERARRILGDMGSPEGSVSGCLRRLCERLRTSEEFPHEIVLFLGYPPENVAGFIGERGAAKCVGCWKVYGDVEQARRLFTQYEWCTAIYLKQHAQGKGIERLTVAV